MVPDYCKSDDLYSRRNHLTITLEPQTIDVIVLLDVSKWLYVSLTSLPKKRPELANYYLRPGQHFMELLQPLNLLTHKKSCLIRSASRLKFHFLFLVKEVRVEYKSKAINLTRQFGL